MINCGCKLLMATASMLHHQVMLAGQLCHALANVSARLQVLGRRRVLCREHKGPACRSPDQLLRGKWHSIRQWHLLLTAGALDRCRHLAGAICCAALVASRFCQQLRMASCTLRSIQTASSRMLLHSSLRHTLAACLGLQVVPTCDGNGDVSLPYGSSQYVGLGFSVFATLVVVELFGSPALRNVQVRSPKHFVHCACQNVEIQLNTRGMPDLVCTSALKAVHVCIVLDQGLPILQCWMSEPASKGVHCAGLVTLWCCVGCHWAYRRRHHCGIGRHRWSKLHER